MNISWVSSQKRAEVNEKHFNNKLCDSSMNTLVKTIVKNHTHWGTSDIKKDGRDKAIIVFGKLQTLDKTFCVILCKDSFNRGDCKVVTMYDVRNPEHKAKRFGLKERSIG